jgi:hypothetical protein
MVFTPLYPGVMNLSLIDPFVLAQDYPDSLISLSPLHIGLAVLFPSLHDRLCALSRWVINFDTGMLRVYTITSLVLHRQLGFWKIAVSDIPISVKWHVVKIDIHLDDVLFI